MLESTLPWSLGIAGVVLLLIGAIGLTMANRREGDDDTITLPAGGPIPTPRETPTDQPSKTQN
jgi:hypothetical protein